MTEDEQVAQGVGCAVCAVIRGKDVACGIRGVKRGGFEHVSPIHLPFVTDSTHSSGACDRLFLVVKRI